MLKEPDPDPGGEASGPQTSREIKDLQEENEQQQVLIAQLKEMLRKEQTTVPQEKVEKYINTLSKAKAKKSRLKRDDSGSTEKGSTSMDSKKHEKVNLLKQQLEENKAKLAERGMRQKDLQEMVTAIKTQLNDTQQIINATPAGQISIEKNLEYNKNTSPEELYNILLVKERKITELFEKTHKQEGTILDLQENLKEKDQVIDARTKAITLMTDNLSKKGKNTLDALDETKEQMRKMQENFITLESEMKARQMMLLNDLKNKNIEITELQEEIEQVRKEKNEMSKSNVEKPEEENHELIIKDLQQKLADAKKLNEENASKINDLESQLQNTQYTSGQSSNSEIEKLKKQLDESNKNMIKVKAQNKSKIKDLNKKLDSFKKMSDANATIIQLQNDVTKLNEKIAELEEEKGNMQLKMVESIESLKGSSQADDVKELQDKLARNSEELDEKDKIISLLETDIISLKTEITNLAEKNSSLTDIQNEQVTSEIQSIQIEEQFEALQSENSKLKEEIDNINKQKNELLERIEEFNKEKVDLTSKLESYIQENMELLDKLEKLSAEKVSSAESIEIVEGLTQQEKLELAAYQKQMETNLEETIKVSEEEPPAELNESVLQLTEDSAELLSKIEMFNIERKEVMMKLDALREENNQLSLKLNEIENNRDILAETYEQVQTEKEDLQKENDELAKKLKELKDGKVGQNEEVEDMQVSVQLADLQREFENILSENADLKQTLKDFDKNVHEKDNLESELSNAKEKITELETKLKENLEEINNYQTIIEENKTEFINSSNIINQLQIQLSETENDKKELNVLISDLNAVVNDLQNENNKLGDFEIMEKQVDELKKSLNEQIELAQSQAEDFKEEIAWNKQEMEKQVEEKQREKEKLTEELLHKDSVIENLKDQLREKDVHVHKIIDEMKQKYLGLQEQLDSNSVTLNKQDDLTKKNRELTEKLKKVAANLKKKTHALQELESRYNDEKEKWETEINKKESSSGEVVALQTQLEALNQELQVKSKALENSDIQIKELKDVIQTLQQQNVDLQNMLLEARHKQEKVAEVNLKQELSTSLHEEFDNLHGNNESTNEDKVKELQLIIEMNESELTHFKERSQKLEEDLAVLLEEKDGLLVKCQDLHQQLGLMSKHIEEKSRLEDQMGQQLQEITTNDEVLTRQLEEIKTENKELTDKNREQEELIMKFKVKIKKTQEKISQLKTLQSSLEEQENLNADLKKQLAHLETTQKHSQMENDELQKQMQRDYEKIETDYQLQLEGLIKSRNELTFECEKLEEAVKSLKDREEELILENNEFKQKIDELQTDYNNQIVKLKENLNHVSTNWEESLQKVATLETAVDTLQKQIIVDTAKETIEEVITEAKEKVVEFNTKDTQTDATEISPFVTKVPPISTEVPLVSQSQERNAQLDIPAFNWGDESDQSFQWGQDSQQASSWFDDNNFQPVTTAPVQTASAPIQPVPVQTAPVQSAPQKVVVTKEDLESKIKALEVLLYNVDKEKEAVIKECSEMLNELTRLVYEKVSAQTPSTVPQPPGDLESQIMSLEQVKAAHDKRALQELEFETTDASVGPSLEPVEEVVGPPTTAYLTYEPEPILSDVESQIMSPDSIDAFKDPAALQQLEFERTDPDLGQQRFPVVERLAQPTKAYLTYQVGEAVGENDDGWGWGPEEARLEEEHQYKSENTPQVQALKSDIEQLRQKVETLLEEKDAHCEEMKQLQVKCGRIMKKCKDLKAQNEQLLKKSDKGDDFFDLDQTIQEELKSQIQQLEKKIKETSAELEKEKLEKSNILKRVDVLTAANEKMLEMKEIQESEILKYKRKLEETQSSFGWGDELQDTEIKKKEPRVQQEEEREDVEELKRLIKDLTADNEELQALLDDQKNQRVQLERSKSLTNETRLSNLEEELQNKEALIRKIEEERDRILSEIKKEIDEKTSRIQELEEQMHKSQSEDKKELDNNIKELEDKLVHITEEKTKLEDEIRQKIELLEHSEENLRLIHHQNEELKTALAGKTKELENNAQLEEVKALLIEKTALAEEFKSSNDTLHQQIQTLSFELEHLKNEFGSLEANSTQIIKDLKAQLEQQNEVDLSIQDATQQRASDVRELIQLFKEEQYRYHREKLEYEEAGKLCQDNVQASSELEKELKNQQEQYHNLQIATSKIILELQSELEESKQKLDQIQIENSSKLNEVVQELEESKRRCAELQFEQDIKVSQTQDVDEKLQEMARLQSSLIEKDTSIKELKTLIEELQNQKAGLEGEMKEMKDSLNEKQIELDRIENEMVESIARLEEKWAAQVDERGNTVAESWKYHLSIVESDFAAVQEKLKNEINELEEKCNLLVNENNELRKNADVDIKNEVDRISALQQQITDRQHSINDLNKLLSTEQMEKAALAQQVLELEKTQQLLADKEVEFIRLNSKSEAIQQELDEQHKFFKQVIAILEENTSFPLPSVENEILDELRRQLNLSSNTSQEINSQFENLNSQLHSYYSVLQERDAEILKLKEDLAQLQSYQTAAQEKETEILRLKEETAQLQTYYNTIQDKDLEILRLHNLVSDLQIQTNQITDKDQEIVNLTQNVQNLNDQLKQLDQKEAEIVRLQAVMNEYKETLTNNERALQNLQQQLTDTNLVVENQKQQLQDFSQMYNALQSTFDERNQQISTLNQQLQVTQNNKEAEKLENELTRYKDECLKLQHYLDECQQQLFNITQDLATKTHEYQTVSQQLAYSQQNADFLQGQINDLNGTLHQKEQEYLVSLENLNKSRYKEIETHYEELMAAKDLDIQTLRAQVAESVYNASEQSTLKAELENQVKKLEEQIVELTTITGEQQSKIKELEEKLSEQTSLSEEETKQLSEMRGIIEEQVVKIEDLKKELFQKSNDYDSLIAQMDISRSAITQQPVASTSIEVPSHSSSQRPPLPEEEPELVNRAELDIALYMLHQRDVRCEELTVELTHLLEERDTLQLRLSTAIREKEDMRRKNVGGGATAEPTTSTSDESVSPRSRTSEIFLAASGTELTSEPAEHLTAKQDLASKLSELKQVGYRKDKTFVDEQELRRLQQMSIMQQHIKEASKLPPEAAAKLVDASYTLSRDVQSPSKVLLNWLWGRSTPRVNET
uniref:Protein lava lamp-like n=1 Tax=Diabrotica virgifera virgifera TaxID=50390 RepID=A0A6P7F5F7_DIAVI